MLDHLRNIIHAKVSNSNGVNSNNRKIINKINLALIVSNSNGVNSNSILHIRHKNKTLFQTPTE